MNGAVAALRPGGWRINVRVVSASYVRLRTVFKLLVGCLGYSGNAFAYSANNKYVSLLLASRVLEKFVEASRVRNGVSSVCSFVGERILDSISSGHVAI